MEKNKIITWTIRIVILLVVLAIVAFILKVAPDYGKDINEGKTNLIINNNNITAKLKKELIVQKDGEIYLAREDVKNFFDPHLHYDADNKTITTTSDTKVAKVTLGDNQLVLNGKTEEIKNGILEQNGTIYLPISIMEKVYNIEVNHIKETDIITIDSLNREQIKYTVDKKTSVKYRAKVLSKTVDKLEVGEKFIWVADNNKGWSKIRTENGKIGYIKTEMLTNQEIARQKQEMKKQIEGKISLVWDYYSEYVSAPNRAGTKIEGINVVSPSFFSLKQGEGIQINDNATRGGEAYVQWAHENNYKVWAMFSNNSMRETTSKILNSEALRAELIETIVNLAKQYKLDGINIDFENMNVEDKNIFSLFLIELAPRLRDMGVVTSVDVTAPDGSDTWSLCYNRNVLADVVDYMMFMAYDQHGTSSNKAGTVAGYNWVEANIKKFLGQEEVKPEKIILGMPLYTRLWKTNIDKEDSLTSIVVNMNKVEQQLPKEVEKVWDEDLKQNYIEYTDKNIKYQMWIEDAKSIKEKLGLINQYNLAGGAYWEKDREVEEIWNLTKEMLEIK